MLSRLPLWVASSPQQDSFSADEKRAAAISDAWGFPIVDRALKPTDGFYLQVCNDVLGLVVFGFNKHLALSSMCSYC